MACDCYFHVLSSGYAGKCGILGIGMEIFFVDLKFLFFQVINPTEHFTFLGLQNPSIGVSELHKVGV